MPKQPHHTAGSRETYTKPRKSDIEWGRPVFQAPDVLNPRMVFDPTPFRTQPTFAMTRRSAAR